MWYNVFGVKEGFVSMPSRIAITVGSPAVIGSEMVDKTVDWLWSAIECGEIEVAFRAKLAFLEAEAFPADHTPGMPRACRESSGIHFVGPCGTDWRWDHQLRAGTGT